jgi:iron complex transport system permease protein
VIARLEIGKERNYPVKFTVIGITLLAVIAVSFCLGRYATTPGQFIEIIRAMFANREPNVPRDVQMVFSRIRIPRIAAAVLAGAGLSVSG